MHSALWLTCATALAPYLKVRKKAKLAETIGWRRDDGRRAAEGHGSVDAFPPECDHAQKDPS